MKSIFLAVLFLTTAQFCEAQVNEVYVRFRSANAVGKVAVNAKENLFAFTPSLQRLQQRVLRWTHCATVFISARPNAFAALIV